MQNVNADRRVWLNRSLVWAGLAGAGSLGLSSAAFAQSGGAYTEGRHYQRLAQALPVSVPAGKVEVLEFFSYACPHCSAFEPALHAWSKKLPADVVFRRVPVNFLVNAENFQRLYFALEALGQVDAVQAKVFAAVHVQRERLASPEAVADFVAKNGVDRAKFLDAFNAFGVQAKVRQVPAQISAFKIEGVPSLAIQGQYVTAPSMAGAEGMPVELQHSRCLELADQLIARARKGA
jgi:thiol:disulfide interchange protein DsbA